LSQGEDSSGKPSPGRRSWADLGPRLASAFVLVPVTAITLYFGGYLFAAAVGAVFAGAYREWDTMVTLKPLTPFGIGLILLVFIAAMLFPQWGPAASLAVVVVAGAAALIRGGEGAVWRAGGLIYFGLVITAVLALRGNTTEGLWVCVLLGAVIWLTDTGAFFTGRQIGGEKLAPGISPAKTWSGALGGLALGTVCGLLVWHFATASPWLIGLVLCAATSILGQSGDLAESALKRRFRIKDSGDIIPGHGGLMDRLDSVTFGALFLCLVGALHGEAGIIAAGVLHW
jgi:phosphatidate cytidylyltransferase